MADYVVYKGQIDADPNSELEVNYIGLVDYPAIERNFQAFAKEKAKFTIDEDKRIIIGPAMIADMPLYRNDKKFGEYYVVFDSQAIQTIAEKFAANGYMKNFNLMHDDQQKLEDVVMFNSFITSTAMGVMPPKGFEDVADGSWFIAAKVNNDDAWAKVKSGEIKGFSVEGIFNYVPVAKVKMTSEQLMKKIETLLSETIIED